MGTTEQGAISPDPYWWEAAPLRRVGQKPVAQAADVLSAGAGYTRLSAAIPLARAGGPVLVCDTRRPPEGAPSRDGGMTSGTPRPSVAATTKSFGEKRAKGTLAESKAAREDLWWYGG